MLKITKPRVTVCLFLPTDPRRGGRTSLRGIFLQQMWNVEHGMTMLSLETAAARPLAMQPTRSDGQAISRASLLRPRSSQRDAAAPAPPPLALTPVRPPMPDRTSWFTALLIALGLLLLWAWLRLA